VIKILRLVGRMENISALARPGWTAPTPPPAAPKTAAATTVAYTLRLDSTESIAVDALVLALRTEAGRKTLDRSEVIRALLQMTGEDAAVRVLLLRKIAAAG